MALYPGAKWRPLGPNPAYEPEMESKDILCFHTMVGYLESTDEYFRQNGYYGVESHWGVGGSADGKLDGAVWQWQNTKYGADANLDGKDRVLSIETSDGGDENTPWSPRQIDSLVELGIWVCKTFNIPPKLVPDTKQGRRGIAYHRQGCDHSSSYQPGGWPYDIWRVPRGEKWSNITGKTCPGDVRIRQLVDEVIPRIRAGVEGDELTPEEHQWLRDVWEMIGREGVKGKRFPGKMVMAIRKLLRFKKRTDKRLGRVDHRTREMHEQVRPAVKGHHTRGELTKKLDRLVSLVSDHKNLDPKAVADALAEHLDAPGAKAVADELYARMAE